MQSLINQLAKEAGVELTDQTLKFAELIVRKCGDIAFYHWCDTKGSTHAEKTILELFNVESI